MLTILYRKVEGEAKGEGHDAGGPATSGPAVPLRRWEDWERSRLRKIRREERRRKDLERMQGAYMSANGELTARQEIFSQYEGSDTVSLASSDEDQWGAQIGGYNENSAAFPPPPMGLQQHAFASAETIAAADMTAMLDAGFDDEPSPPSSRAPSQAPRFQLSDAPPSLDVNGYAPLSRSGSPGPTPGPRDHAFSPVSPIRPTGAVSTAVDGDWRGHAKKRSAGRHDTGDYGPLGPLDPGSRI